MNPKTVPASPAPTGRDRFAIPLFLAMTFLLSGVSPLSAQVELKLATILPERTPWTEYLRTVARQVEEATDHALTFRFYLGGVRGDERKLFEALQAGRIDGGLFSSTLIGKIYPSCRVLDILGFWREKPEKAFDLIRKEMFDTFTAGFRERGFVLVSFLEIGPVYVFSRKPLANYDDLVGVKMWSYEEDPIISEIFRISRLIPVPLPLPKVGEELHRGLINAFFASPIMAISFQWTTEVRYFTTPPITHLPLTWIIRLERWNEIPPQHRTKLLEIAWKEAEKTIATIRRTNAAGIAALRRQGLREVPIDEAAVEESVTLHARVTKALTDSYIPRGVIAAVNERLRRAGLPELGKKTVP